MPPTTTGAFGCPASLPAPFGCWLGLVGLGVAPAAYAGALLVYQRLARNQRRRWSPGSGLLDALDAKQQEEQGDAALAETKVDGSSRSNGGSTNGYQALPADGRNDEAAAAAAQQQEPPPPPPPPSRRWRGVVKHGAWPGLYLREFLVMAHVGFQLYMLLPLLGVLVASSGAAGGGGGGGGGGAGDFWWQHNLVGFKRRIY
jgi:hypothetical protein